MKFLTKNTDYAARALLVLAGHRGEYISARQVAREQKMPYQFTRRILQGLIKNGLVSSREGGHGGVKLEKDPKDIRIMDLINIFQGEVELFDCMFRDEICHNRETCILRHKIKRIEEIVKHEFEDITIASLMAREK